MKKSKVILAVALAIVLMITCVSVPTFSWFTRPQTQSGEKMVLDTKKEYTAYNGKNVTIVTKSSQTGAMGSEDSYTTVCTTSADLSGSGIPTFNRKYFRTTITNSSGSEQNVSLYVRKLSVPTSDSNGSLALGVNEPTRNYRDYSALATPSSKTTNDTMRIYFEKDNNVEGWNGTDFYICFSEDPDTRSEVLDALGSNGTYYKLTHVGGSGYPNQYYADIPKTATHAFFAVENWGTNDNGLPKYTQRSQTLWDLSSDGQSQTSSILCKITTGSTHNVDGHAVKDLARYTTISGNCINSYYSTIYTAMGNTFNAALSSGEYIGTLKYYTSNSSVFTVNENTGVITPVAAGEATLYTKSTGGSYPDEQQVETTVIVTSTATYDFNDVPIVRNVKIPVDDPATEDVFENKVDVYWYIINNSTANSLSYTIDEVYVGL